MNKSNTNLDLRRSIEHSRNVNSKGALSSFARMSELQGEDESR